MNEKQLVNAATKILALLLVTWGVMSLGWATFVHFAQDRIPELPLAPQEAASWLSGIAYVLIGSFLAVRSTWVTELLFAFDQKSGKREQRERHS